MLLFRCLSSIIFITCVALLLTPYAWLAPFIALGCIGLIVLYRHPAWGLLGLIFLVPFEGLFEGTRFFTGAKVLGAALLVIVACQLILRQLPIARLGSTLWRPLTLFLLFYVISVLHSNYFELSINSLRQMLTAVAIFILTLVLAEDLRFKHIMSTLVLAVAMTALIALYQSYSSDNNRATGLLKDPNYFALLVSVAIAMAGYLILHQRNWLISLFWAGVLVILLMTFMKTYSRSGALVLLIVIGFAIWHYRDYLHMIRARHLGWVLLSLAVAMPVLHFSIPEDYKQRLFSLLSLQKGIKSFDDRSLGRRASYLVVGWQSIKENPWVGSGPGSFPVSYAYSGYASAFSLSRREPELFRRAHNTYLELAVESGLVVSLLFCWLAWRGLLGYWQVRTIALQKQRFSLASSVTHLGLAFLALCIFLLFLSAPNHKYFWCMLAIAEVVRRYCEKQSRALTEESRHEASL
ncbi:O-antigen ligase family protein [Zooshikella ganghwensis]|uniref:O-antigen ligase family protein n=1 Tax=Zooshikella ganghwensis TaxID=202772 RepID=A0A4P9VUC9_9GAMM|nr:O-antigen ligase family protein [Zooshikella ganghwensis]RDH45922.1 O-antigen ligase family protein [Zooshikella ganghwensis]